MKLADAKSGGELTDAWVHLALTVDGDRITPYIDGVEATNVGNFHHWGCVAKSATKPSTAF